MNLKMIVIVLPLVIGQFSCKTRQSAYANALELFGLKKKTLDNDPQKTHQFYFRVNELQSGSPFLCRTVCKTRVINGKVEGCSAEGRLLPVRFLLEHTAFLESEKLKSGLGNFLFFAERSGSLEFDDVKSIELEEMRMAIDKVDSVFDVQGVSTSVCGAALRDDEYIQGFESVSDRDESDQLEVLSSPENKLSRDQILKWKEDNALAFKLVDGISEVYKSPSRGGRTFMIENSQLTEVVSVNEYLFGFLKYGNSKVFQTKTGVLVHRVRIDRL